MTRWFRMYDELLDDPKVQKLPAEDFKAWVNLLALASRNGGVLPAVEDIAFALRRSTNDVETLLERLLNATHNGTPNGGANAGLIDKRNGGPNGYHYAPHGWEKRQYKSDGSTDRVKRFRKRSRNGDETLHGTGPEPETESDTEQTPQPPADRGARPGHEPSVSALASDLCKRAGIATCGPAAIEHVRRWLADGIPEALIRSVVVSMATKAPAKTLSLKRFDAPIRREHSEAARPPPRSNGAAPAKPRADVPPAEPTDPAERDQVRTLVSGLAQQLKSRETPLPPAVGRR